MKRLLPAYPLFVKDPYFSFWSAGDILNDSPTIFWTGAEKELIGVVKIDGKAYRFLGINELEKIEQVDVEISTFMTTYRFKKDDVIFEVDFVSPLPLDDLELLSCPVCYLKYRFISENKHKYEVALIMHQGWCYNDVEQNYCKSVRGGSLKVDNFEASWFGLKRQLYLSQCSDASLADWGFIYLAAQHALFVDKAAVEEYYQNDLKFRNEEGDRYLVAVSKTKAGTILVGRDDEVAISYFGEFLKTYYMRDNKTIFDALIYTKKERKNIERKLSKIDRDILNKAKKISSDYYQICCASYRQSIAAHKLVENKKGEKLFLSKECCSNGCIGTVDVSYPSIPLYLIYNPELVKGMLLPIFTFARMPVWKYDFAPHDVGTYPICLGQVYGLLETNDRYLAKFAKKDEFLETVAPVYQLPSTVDVFNFNLQMPVEECGNMLLMTYAVIKATKDNTLAEENRDLLIKWCGYLCDFGLIPDNQLCTDDFAGHVDKNINLSIKATVGIRAFAEIEKRLGNISSYRKYLRISKKFAAHIEKVSAAKGYLPLSYNEDDQKFSLKYNLAMDRYFHFNLFSQDLYQREFEQYKKQRKLYGIPLDERKEYTKSDWQMWVASFADEELREIIISDMRKFLEEGKDRAPFTDWYETIEGTLHYFRNRTVQGGNFFPLLMLK